VIPTVLRGKAQRVQRASRLALAGLAAFMAALPTLAAPAAPLRDDLQRPLRAGPPPQRIVSLVPSISETVCALGECARLVGTDRYSNWPASVAALPKVGGLDDAQIEAIVALKPDVVLLGGTARVTARLEQLGIATFALEVQTQADIARSIRVLAQVLGVPERAAPLNAQIDAGMARVAQQAAARRTGREPPSVYFEVSSEPYAAGPASFIGALLARLSTRNIVAPELGPFPLLNPEYVVRQNPTVIMVSANEAARLAARPGWSTIRAVRERRLCSFTSTEGDAIVRPGPRVVEGMQALADCLARVAP